MQLVEISLVSSTMLITSHPETVSYAGKVYAPFPLNIADEQISGDGQVPTLPVQVSNYAGLAYKFVKENDLTLHEVVIRRIHTLSSSGDEAKVRLWIRGVTFANEVAAFELGFKFSLEEEGPRRQYDRRSFPGIPLNLRAYSFI